MAKSSSRRSPLNLPQHGVAWFVVVHEMNKWIARPDGEPVRPWLVLIINMQNGTIIHSEMMDTPPRPASVQRLLFQAMRKREPQIGLEPHRPAEIFFEDETLTKKLWRDLSKMEVTISIGERPAEIDQMLAGMEEHVKDGGVDVPSLMDQQGATPEVVGGMFDAAADFYRAATWAKLTDKHPLAIEVLPTEHRRYALVMGSGGMEYGLSVYLEWEQYTAMASGLIRAKDDLPDAGVQSLLYMEVTGMPFGDLGALKQHQWEIADKKAYPLPVIFDPVDGVSRPDGAEIFWYEAVLRAIPIFAEQHLQQNGISDFDPVEAIITVPTSKGDTEVRISYPAGELPDQANRMPDALDDLDVEGAIDMPIFDRRAAEGAMAGLVGGTDDSALGRAQDLMYEAFESNDPNQRILKAYEALELSPDCADAYVLLAQEEADTYGEALEYFLRGVMAGRRALGPDRFEEDAGHFWGLLETRPYMRALEGLAQTFKEMGEIEESIGHFRELLRLNPSDNQGIRHQLLNALLDAELDQEAAVLLTEHDDGMAEWLYTDALLLFRSGSKAKGAKLKEALRHNPHVPDYLTGRKKIPVQLPPYMGFGDENEAVHYAAAYLRHWRKMPEAIEWLKQVSTATK